MKCGWWSGELRGLGRRRPQAVAAGHRPAALLPQRRRCARPGNTCWPQPAPTAPPCLPARLPAQVTGEGEDKYLIATSEQTLCALHRKDWLDPRDLPKK